MSSPWELLCFCVCPNVFLMMQAKKLLNKKILAGLLLVALITTIFLVPGTPMNNIAKTMQSTVERATNQITGPLQNAAQKLFSENSETVRETEVTSYPSEWYEGESVHVKYIYPRLVPDPSMDAHSSFGWVYQKSPDVIVEYREYLYENDGKICNLVFKTYEESQSYSDRYVMIIDIGSSPREGTLYFNASTYISGGTIDSAQVSVSSDSGAYVFTLGSANAIDVSPYINADGRIYVEFIMRYTTDSTDGSSYYDHYAVFNIDQLVFVPKVIESDVRSQYQYQSSTQIKHKLVVENHQPGATIYVYAPLNWNLTGVSPYCGWSYDASEQAWVLSGSIIEAFYTLIFMSGDGWGVDFQRKAQILAVQDISSDYLQVSDGFESGSLGAWSVSDLDPNFYADLSLDTSVVFDGIFSLKMENTGDAGGDLYFTEVLSPGYYYFAFSYYIENWDDGTDYFRVLYSDDGAYSWAEWGTLEVIKNRWVQVFGYIHIYSFEGDQVAGAYPDWKTQFAIQIYDSDGSNTFTVYFDNFKFYKPSTSITTTGLNTYQIQGQLLSWDNRQNPPMQNSQVQIQLRDRTANTLVKSWSNIETDSSGVFSVTYSQKLEEKEYEIRIYSYENWFGDYFYDNKDPIDFVEDEDGMSSIWNGAYSWSSGSITFTLTDTIGNLYRTSLSIPGYYHYFLTCISSYTGTGMYFIVQQNSVWNNINPPATTSTGYFFVDAAQDSGYSISATIQSWGFQTLGYSGDYFTILFMKAWDISAFSSIYFTPIPAGQSVYQYEGSEEWDFSEGTLDGWFRTGSYSELTSSSGYIALKATTDTSWVSISVDPDPITTSEYPYLAWRYRIQKGNSTSIPRFRVIAYTEPYSSTSYDSYFVAAIDDGDWHVVSITFSIGKKYTLFRIYPLNGSNSFTPYLAGGDTIYFDWVRLVHIKSSNLNVGDTYAFARSENNSLSYAIYSDNAFAGYYDDLELLQLNMSLGSHNLTLVPINDYLEAFPGIFLPNYQNKLEYVYEITEDFVVSVYSWYLSDLQEHMFVTATKNGYWYIYHNDTLQGSGVLSKEGTTISIDRDLTPGATINFAAKFVNGTDIVWFNTTITNARPETILIYVYDLSGQRLYQPPWDLYYNGSILETYVVTVPAGTFNPGLVQFKDLFGNIHSATLINTTTSLQGYKVCQFMLNAYEVELYNENTENAAKLAVKNADGDWLNYTLAPGERRKVWLSNETYDWFAYVTKISQTTIDSLDNATYSLIGNTTAAVTKPFKFGISMDLHALMGDQDITNNQFIQIQQSEERQKYALYITNLFGLWELPEPFAVSWSQLFFVIFSGIVGILFVIARVYVQRFTEEYIDERGRKRRRRKNTPMAQGIELLLYTLFFFIVVVVLGAIVSLFI